MGDLIRFPVERCRSQVVSTAGVVFSNVRSSVAGVEMVAVQVDSAAPAWWGRVGEVTGEQSPRFWMKLGLFPGARARQHRVIAIQTAQVGRAVHLVALAACGRRAPISEGFDEEAHDGKCQRCRRRGWR